MPFNPSQTEYNIGMECKACFAPLSTSSCLTACQLHFHCAVWQITVL